MIAGGDTPYTGMSNSRARERIDSGKRKIIKNKITKIH